VLCRPVLREYELVCLGRSGAAAERQLPLSDLSLSVSVDGTILLYSRRLNRRIIPRLTNAHGFMNPRLSTFYRFLAYLQHQGAAGIPLFAWGPLEAIDYLPRVRYGRLILAVARWKIAREEVRQLDKSDRFDAFAAMQQLRARRRLPRWVVFVEVDNTLPVDLDNPLCVDALIQVLARAGEGVLTEMYPTPDALCVTGPEGRFCHELLVPFVRERPRPQSEAVAGAVERALAAAPDHVPAAVRSCAPGGEWLYFKVYGGGGALDDALTSAIAPLLEQIGLGAGRGRWFFVRYGDPDQHLRIRFHGAPQWLMAELLPLVHRTLEPLRQRGRIWKVQVDTYEREVEAYGGPGALALAEEIFCADSDAVLEILRALDGDEGADVRWRIALLGIHRLFEDCGIGGAARREAIALSRDAFMSEFRVGPIEKKRIADRFRAERRAIDALFDPEARQHEGIVVARAAFGRRSRRLQEAVAQLDGLAKRGMLRVPLTELVGSYAHLHVNRMMGGSGRAHELVLYDFLSRVYDAQLAKGSEAGQASAVLMS
jgi:lantibiotic biosynthesis protein